MGGHQLVVCVVLSNGRSDDTRWACGGSQDMNIFFREVRIAGNVKFSKIMS